MRKRKIMRKLRAHLAHHEALSGSDQQLLTHAQQLAELQRTVGACRDCGIKLAAQAQAIDALRETTLHQATLIAALTEQLAELSRKLESAPRPIPTSPSVPDKVSNKPDNLQRIEGIGPKIAEVLKKEGIATYRDLASTDASRLKNILVAANIRVPADPTTWPKQAELAAEGKWDELHALQAILDGGRMPT